MIKAIGITFGAMNKTVINSTNAPAPIGPYSQAIVANGILYISGQIALHPQSGELVMDDINKETTQVMENLKAILTAAGMGFSNAVKTTILLSDMSLFAAVNEVYGSYFDQTPPARETFAVKGLPKGVNVEISMMAIVGLSI
jgi:2-iminobutanoate/2-iminopropanoate deaminase